MQIKLSTRSCDDITYLMSVIDRRTTFGILKMNGKNMLIIFKLIINNPALIPGDFGNNCQP